MKLFKDYDVSFIDCSSSSLNDLKPYLLPVCATPKKEKVINKMVIFYAVLGSSVALILIVIGLSVLFIRIKHSRYEKKMELERELEFDYG